MHDILGTLLLTAEAIPMERMPKAKSEEYVDPNNIPGSGYEDRYKKVADATDIGELIQAASGVGALRDSDGKIVGSAGMVNRLKMLESSTEGITLAHFTRQYGIRDAVERLYPDMPDR